PPVRKYPFAEMSRSWVPWKVPQLETCTATSRHCPGWGWSGSCSAGWAGASVSATPGRSRVSAAESTPAGYRVATAHGAAARAAGLRGALPGGGRGQVALEEGPDLAAQYRRQPVLLLLQAEGVVAPQRLERVEHLL